MLGNFTAIQEDLDFDHVAISDVTNRGKHNKSTYPVQAGTPPTIIGESLMFGKDYASRSELAMIRDGTTNIYRLTTTPDADPNYYTRFGTNTNYVGTQVGGWTFLPGGLILQYGRTLTTGHSTTINFPLPFAANPYSLSAIRVTFNGSLYKFAFSDVTPFSFNFENESNTAGRAIRWMAIGIG
jgi:hypothetical protein